MKYTHLIWDFNGTVLDDVEIGIASANALLARCGLSPIPSVEYYRSVFGFPVRDYYRRLGIDFSKTSFEELAPIWVEEYLSRVDKASLYDGVLETLVQLKRKGVRQILLSATEIDMLKGQLEALGIESYFDGIFGADNIHASSKKKQAEMWCLENPSAKPLFFGDTNHDFEVAEAVGGDCILFSGGHQSEERLLEIGCPVVRRISDIVSYFS